MAMSNTELEKDMFEPAAIDQSSSEKIAGESISSLRDSMRRFFKNIGAMISMVVVGIIIVMAIVGPHMFGYGIDDQNIRLQNLPPKISALSWIPAFDGIDQNGDAYKQKNVKKDFWFGTDTLGRDIWTRTWSGTRVSLIIALVATLVDIFIGVTYGGVAGYFGGKTDNIMQRIIEIVAGIPNLVWIILLILVLQPGLLTIAIAITATSWLGMARLIRGEMLKLKNQEFVLASRTLGAGDRRIIFKHLIPNSLGMIIINTMFSIPNAIFFEAFLSFIGLGIRRPEASLGSIINDGFSNLMIYPYMTLYPCIVISLLLICFNLMGDGLRDAFDPKLRR
ncbi:oligopeptide ABC transporter permease [Sporolactobacillus laevolacticus]|uniref:oligopeptide ABC transporter permease n=1 Tax=Sporolactobacillus laevolacticus TaxID=33018 RepID=UPI0025B3114E|nr:oligopeptide ABC transporter permease [Sporolactobacillus laevolacticus]MDN3954200.1 ABC transporter permease [Sporolactobacillus laevolacticus]